MDTVENAMTRELFPARCRCFWTAIKRNSNVELVIRSHFARFDHWLLVGLRRACLYSIHRTTATSAMHCLIFITQNLFSKHKHQAAYELADTLKKFWQRTTKAHPIFIYKSIYTALRLMCNCMKSVFSPISSNAAFSFARDRITARQ